MQLCWGLDVSIGLLQNPVTGLVQEEKSLTGAEVAPAAIIRVRVLPASASRAPRCCSCPSLVLQAPLLWSQARSCSPVPQISQKSQEEVGRVPAGSGEPGWDMHGPKVSRCPKKGPYCLSSQGRYLPRVWALLAQELLVPLSGGSRGDGQFLAPSKASYACKNRTNFAMPC